MTIKQLHELLPRDQALYIAWDGSAERLNRDSVLELDAFGSYVIQEITAMGESKIEAALLAQPVRE